MWSENGSSCYWPLHPAPSTIQLFRNQEQPEMEWQLFVSILGAVLTISTYFFLFYDKLFFIAQSSICWNSSALVNVRCRYHHQLILLNIVALIERARAGLMPLQRRKLDSWIMLARILSTFEVLNLGKRLCGSVRWKMIRSSHKCCLVDTAKQTFPSDYIVSHTVSHFRKIIGIDNDVLLVSSMLVVVWKRPMSAAVVDSVGCNANWFKKSRDGGACLRDGYSLDTIYALITLKRRVTDIGRQSDVLLTFGTAG